MRTPKLMIATLAASAVLSFVLPANAQFKATGDDGITASPKVRAQLNGRAEKAVSVKTSATMACAVCKDEYVKRTDWTVKGATKPTVITSKHLCSGCETSIALTGTGKAKENVLTHKCSFGDATKAKCCLLTGLR
jgi:hypothetical protein